MKSVGQTGSAAMPRAKPGDHERALALLASVADPKATKKSLTELKDATAAHDASREAAEAATAEAKRRQEAAQAAEADATRARQLQADETAEARTELGQRETAVTERERLAGEVEQAQAVRAEGLAEREDHLKRAGVRGF